MEKRKILFLLICIFAIFTLVSCNFELPNIDDIIDNVETNNENNDDNQNEEQDHVHEYSWTIEQEATCLIDGVKLGTCSIVHEYS